MPIRREPFVGRAAELEILSGRLELARQGHPQVVLVEGEAGIGKSRLVEEALGDAGGVVLWAVADEVERPLAFGVLDQLLRGRGGDARGDLPRTDPASAGGYLVDLLGELQSDGLVIVVVDDVPWADALSVQALVFALRRLRFDQVAMILTARSDELAWLPRGVEQLLSAPGGTRLRLAGLGPDVLRELARRLGAGNPSLAGARRLAEHTGGNALHAATLLTKLPAGTLEAGGDAPLPAPSSFAMLALARLARCRAATRDLVVVAAVLGLQAGVDDLARLTATPDPLPLIEEAVTGGLLVPARPPGTVAFAHPLVRAAVYHDVGLQQRAELHRRAAGIAGDEWPRLRHRAAAALGPDDDLVTELAAFAGRRAEDGPAGAAVAAAAYQLAAPLASIRARREDLTLQPCSRCSWPAAPPRRRAWCRRWRGSRTRPGCAMCRHRSGSCRAATTRPRRSSDRPGKPWPEPETARTNCRGRSPASWPSSTCAATSWTVPSSGPGGRWRRGRARRSPPAAGSCPSPWPARAGWPRRWNPCRRCPPIRPLSPGGTWTSSPAGASPGCGATTCTAPGMIWPRSSTAPTAPGPTAWA